MRILQDICDLILLALISPMAWAALTGLLFLTFAIREARSTEEGSRKWRDYVHSGAGRRRIAAASILLVVVAIALFRFITAGSHGYCATDGTYRKDEDFVRAALVSDANFMFRLSPSEVTDRTLIEKVVDKYMKENPDCCKVFRVREDEVGELSWIMWLDGVVVRIRNEESLTAFRAGTKRPFDVGLRYVWVGNCLVGADVIPEITPGV